MSLSSFQRFGAVILTAAMSGALSGASAQTQVVPTGPVANAAVEINAAISGRIINCPKGLNVSANAVCLLTKGTTATLQPKISTRLGERVLEDWKLAANSRNASLFFATDDVVTYVLLAQAGADNVLAIIDAPGTQAEAPSAPAGGVAYVPASSLGGVLDVQVTGSTGTFTRPGQKLIVTAGRTTARLNDKSMDLAGAPYEERGALFVPVTALRQLGCVVTPAQRNQFTVVCGGKTANVIAAVK